MSLPPMPLFVGTFALLVCLAACQSGAPQTDSAPQAVPTTGAAQVIPTAAGLDRTEVQKLVCGTTTPCVLTDLKPADAAQSVHIAEVAYLANPDADGSWKNPNFDLPDNCNAWSLFAVKHVGAKLEATKVAHFCNDGHGASGVGEDRWQVKNGRLSVGSNGGSNWRWDHEHTLDLARRAIVSRSSFGHFGSNPDIVEEHHWDFETFSGKTAWTIAPCDNEETEVEYAASVIPSLTLPSAFVASDWKTTSPGTCATTLDATAKTGYVIHGQPSTAADTAMQLVASDDGHLFVEIHDDQLRASTTGKWIHADHLELWASPDDVPMMQMECVEPGARGTTWQWGIDANDGTVHAAHGKPTHRLQAERVAIPGGARFRVKLPSEAKSITVVYSDSDDGASQERLLATSTFKFANIQSMGSLTSIKPHEATCSVQNGRLVSAIPPTAEILGNAP